MKRAGLVVGLCALGGSVALGAAFPALLRIPRKNPDTATPPPALFSHRGHASLACNGCHPSVFPQAPLGFTHQQMREGQFCGRCHDGHTAFAITGAVCSGCHIDAR